MQANCKRIAMALLAAGFFGCATYPESASTADRAFDAAQGALEDVGVQVTTSDRASGQLRGTRNGIPVAVSIVRLPDGRTRVLGYSKPVGQGEVAYVALGHCHNPAIYATRNRDPSDRTPPRFHGVWDNEAFATLLRNAIAWGTER